MKTIFALLAVYQVKHFLADYPLQRPYMLRKLNADGWVLPLMAHAGVHGAFTFAVSLFFVPAGLALALALADAHAHFLIDRLKANASRGLSPAQPAFWCWLGADQMAHHLTHYSIIFCLLNF
jgi:hypothetical protein